MSRIIITSKDAERIARQFSELISAKGLNAIRRKAVNKVGSDIRKETRVIGPAIIGTSAAALMVQGKAGAPGSDNPAYRLYMASKIPVARMKAAKRKITRRKGRASLALTLPSGDTIRFRSIHREGARFRLAKAGPLPARDLGGVYTNARTAFDRYDELKRVRRRGEREMPGIVAALIEAHMKRGAR